MARDATGGRRRAGDILIEPPLVRNADVVPAVEDRSYIIFIGGALLSAVLGGFLLAILASLAASGTLWSDRTPWLIQAHGWAQLQGWAGLFVAGMAFRLLPRFAGRPPLPRWLNLAVFVPLFAGLVVRTVAQPAAGEGLSPEALLAGHVLWSAGALGLAGVMLVTLARGRKRTRFAPWSVFAFASAIWWIAWAAATVVAGIRGARNDALIPVAFDDAIAWVAMLGAVGNIIWGVQSRSVPIFFGRTPPSLGRVAAPGLLLNAGVALLFAAAWIEDWASRERLVGGGFVLAGVALAWLAPVAGSCWGRAHRLRPRARSAARFVLAANLAAVTCGLLLTWGGIQAVVENAYAVPGARDAARHAFGVGVITLLIIGMAQLIAPFFAVQRLESKGAWLFEHGILALLVAALLLRVAAGLLWDTSSTEGRMHLSAAAGTLAWLGLVLFAVMVIRAVRNEPRIKDSLAASVGVTSRRG